MVGGWFRIKPLSSTQRTSHVVIATYDISAVPTDCMSIGTHFISKVNSQRMDTSRRYQS